jgi:sugar transferase (PEP-CTERM/EpsH1 system associated)
MTRLPPLVVHVLFRLDYGGMENGIVNVVNGLPANEFRHAIIAMTEFTSFRDRIKRTDVEVYALHKKAGKDLGSYVRLYKLLRKLQPTVVHTRNIGTMDCAFIAWLAGVPVRIHGEHGWDVHDPDGLSRKYAFLRRAFNPFVSRFVTVSQDLQRWLIDRIGIAANKIVHICNGVDTTKFQPRTVAAGAPLPADRFPPGCVIVGSTLRFQAIKDPMNLVNAFIGLRKKLQGSAVDVRLLMIGDGALRDAAQAKLAEAQVDHAAWLPGSSDDIPAYLRAMDIYVLGSLREGISNTVLEAMSTGIPLIVTKTGGNVELVEPGVVGQYVPVGNAAALTEALLPYVTDSALRKKHGLAARLRAEKEYSLTRMLRDYGDLYRSFTSVTNE